MLKTIGFLALFFLGLFVFTLYENNQETEEVKGVIEEENLILGYCKTFERYAIALAEENDLDLKLLDSSGSVLMSIVSGDIDYGVIGRRAYSFEIGDDVLETPLEEYGWTLVSSERGFFEYSELPDLEIHTYLEEEKVLDFFDFETNIIFHENIELASQGDLVLINWEDFNDEFELVIPVEGNTKVEKFRTPMLYMKENTPEIVDSFLNM